MGTKDSKDKLMTITLVLVLLTVYGWACWHFGYKEGRQDLINRIYNDPGPLFRDLEKKGIINNERKVNQ